MQQSGQIYLPLGEQHSGIQKQICQIYFIGRYYARHDPDVFTNVTIIDFAARLWPCFRALISGALGDLKALLGDTILRVMEMSESVKMFTLDISSLSSTINTT